MKKKNIILIGAIIILVLSATFYITQTFSWSSIAFITIWIGAMILLRLMITPLLVFLLKSDNPKGDWKDWDEDDNYGVTQQTSQSKDQKK